MTYLPSFLAAAILASTSAAAIGSDTAAAPQPQTPPSAAKSASQLSPWGIDAHPHRTHQFENLDQMIKLTHQAGMEWMRVGFGFSTVCKNPNKMDFERADQIVDRMEAAGINMTAMLQGFDWEVAKSRPELVPLYKHPEAWRKYVRASVERYHKRIKYWIIWNEQDGGFWKPHPDASQYVPLLKIAYEEIKAIDPTCQVVVGGLTDWNVDYLKDMYANGAKGYFDIMACHRYGWGPDVNPQVARKMNGVRRVLADNQQGDMPIWILECGNTTNTAALTQQQPNFVIDAIRYSLEKINRPLPAPLTVAVAVSPRNKVDEVDRKRNWLPGVKLEPIPFEELKDLDPEKYPVLLGSESKNIDEPLLEPYRSYVQRGGLLLALGRLPFYTVVTQSAEGNWTSVDRSQETHPFFRVGFEAHWTKKGLPHFSNAVKTSPEALAGGLPAVKDVYVDRFLSAKNLKPGDRYYPIVQTTHNGKEIGEGMALYTYGDWKGGILMSTASVAGGFTEEQQANLVPRMYLSYIAAGINKIFWYDLHNDGQVSGEPEFNFGLLRWNWSPKPAFYAYKEMTKILGKNPAFVKRIMGKEESSVWALLFRRAEDNREVLVTWAVDEDEAYRVLRKGVEAPLGDFKGNEVHYLPIEGSAADYRVESH